MSIAKLAVVVVLALAPRAFAGQPAAENPASPEARQTRAVVEAAFRSALKPEQKQALQGDLSIVKVAAVLTPDEKAGVRAGLQSAERDAKTPAALREIARGYQLLGGSAADLVRVGRSMQTLDPKSSEGFSLAADGLSESGDAKGAVSAAKKALKLDPQDRRADAIVKLSGLHAPTQIRLPAPKQLSAAFVDGSGGRSADSDLPIKLPVTTRERLDDRSPAVAVDYVSPQAKKAGWFKDKFHGLVALYSLHHDEPSPAEQRRVEALKTQLSSLPTGARLIGSMGGWDSVNRDTLIRFGNTGSEHMNAYTRPLAPGEQAKFGKKYALVLGRQLGSEPNEVVLPIFAHEFSHVRDLQKGQMAPGLRIPSEYGAHRVQIYVYEDIKKNLSSQRLIELRKSDRWEYQEFLGALWEDHILQRYDKDRFIAQFGPSEMNQAREAYQDLKDRRVAPGSPQLDYHLYTDQKRGLYRVLSDEQDVPDMSPGERTPELLRKRESMIETQDAEDEAFRRERGFEIK